MCPVSRVTDEVPAFVQRDPQGVFHGTLAHPLGPRVSPCEPHVGRRSSLLPPLALSSDGRAAPSLLQQSAPARLPQALLCPLPVPAPRLEASALDTPRLSPGPFGGRCWRVSGSTWAALPTRWLPQSAASTPLVFLSSVLTAASIPGPPPSSASRRRWDLSVEHLIARPAPAFLDKLFQYPISKSALIPR